MAGLATVAHIIDKMHLSVFAFLYAVIPSCHGNAFHSGNSHFSPQSQSEAAKGLGVSAFLNVTFLQEITVQRALESSASPYQRFPTSH